MNVSQSGRASKHVVCAFNFSLSLGEIPTVNYLPKNLLNFPEIFSNIFKHVAFLKAKFFLLKNVMSFFLL